VGARPTNIVNLEVPSWRFSVREVQLVFAILVLTASVETWGRVVEAWDGSNYLFSILEYRSAFAPHHRATDDVVQWFVSQVVIKAVSNVAVVELAFGLTYALIPVASIGLCWWIVRRHEMTLILWPLLAMAATATGLIFQVSEVSVMTWMAWPVVCLAIVRPDRYEMNAVGAVLLGLVFFAHPLATVVLAVIAAVYLISSFVAGTWSRQGTLLTAGLLLAAAIRPFVLLDASDHAALSLSTLAHEFRTSLAGLPLATFGLVLAAAALCLLRRGRSDLRLPTLLLAAAGGCLAVWVAHPSRWAGEVGYRDFTVLLSVPFMLLAAADGTRVLDRLVPQFRHTQGAGVAAWRARLQLAVAASAVAAAVACVQSVQFSQLRSELATRLGGPPGRCLVVGTLGFRSTPLDHWSLATLGTVVQGRHQRAVLVQTAADCELYRRTGVLDLRGFAPLPAELVQAGWFRFPDTAG